MIPAVPELFYRLPKNVVRIFSGWNLGWHFLAIVLTVVIVRSGFEWSYYLATRGDVFLHMALPAIMLGTVVPLLTILTLIIIGGVGKKRRITTTAWALGQAALLGYLISCAYKAFTGRRPPPHFGIFGVNGAALTDTSHGFQFGFLRGGIFWGWPSSHTTIAFAMSVCLATLYPKNKLLVFAALGYATYVGLGVSVTIHWCSEFVAGAIIGSVIGKTVGRSFKTLLVAIPLVSEP
jgi:hypothetical protein